MVPWLEHARRAIFQANFHLPAQNHHPLRVGGAMKTAGKTNRAMAQLEAAAGVQGAELRCRLAFGQRDNFIAEFGNAIGIGKKDYFGEIGHGWFQAGFGEDGLAIIDGCNDNQAP